MTSVTPRQKKHVLRLMEDVLDTTPTDKDGLQQIVNRGGEFKEALATLIRQFTAKALDHAFAREIMGKNMLDISDVERYFGTLTEEQRAALTVIPFSEETLRACAKTHILVADVGISLLDVRTKVLNVLFYQQKWYNSEEFAIRTETACWRLIRKTPVDDSFSKGWSEQRALIDTQIDEVPSARQVVYATILNFRVTAERLFEDGYVRTRDNDSNGDRIDIGDFDEHGLCVVNGDDSRCDSDIGIASSRKAS